MAYRRKSARRVSTGGRRRNSYSRSRVGRVSRRAAGSRAQTVRLVIQSAPQVALPPVDDSGRLMKPVPMKKGLFT